MTSRLFTRPPWPIAAALLWHALAAWAQTPQVTIPSPSGYSTTGQCAGYPRLPLKTPEGWCAGLVADERDGLRMPRRILELAPDRFWITDMGNWEPRQGRLLELKPAGQPGEPTRIKVLTKGLDRPHGLIRGPDGRIYVGEAGAIWRTPGGQVEREPVLTGLPADGAHPLTEMVFAPPGHLFVNVGSASDACRADQADKPGDPCPEVVGPTPRASVYQGVFGGSDFKRQSFKPWATGLRNSLGLAITSNTIDGTSRLWQAENSVDYADPLAPAEELNELTPGANFGWPYCVTDTKGNSVAIRTSARAPKKRVSCPVAEAKAPFQAWPAHVAPLQLLAVPRAKASETARPWSGRLLAVWHGYREPGHRIVAWKLDAQGRPTGDREDLVSDWAAEPDRRPLGSPAGITVDTQGRLWIVEDRNRTVIVIAPEQAPAAGK